MTAARNDTIDLALGDEASLDGFATPLFVVKTEEPLPRSLSSRASKRVVDVVGAALLLVVLSPLLLAMALAVRVTSAGPVLFRQQRVGAGSRPFTCFKFRSMHADAEIVLHTDVELLERYLANNHKLDLGDDPRLTSIGHWLRRSSLDELPQLWNVLRGDMSLVGPRPVLPGELVLYGAHVDSYYAARPGITGRWQVSGRSHISYDERVGLDAGYVETWSHWQDLLILAKTPLAVVRCHGSV